MSARLFVLAFFLFFTALLEGREKTDIMVMTNGDHLTCEIKGLEAGVLYVSFDYIDGTASVDWSKVARVESSQLFVVKTEGGAVYAGTLRTPKSAADRPMKIQIVSPEQESIVERSQIVEMIGTSDKFLQRFNGEVSFGVIYSKGNQSTQYNLGSKTAYVRERWTALAGLNSSLSSSSGTNAATHNTLDLGARHFLPWNNWFYAGLGGFLQSSEQGIALQSTVGGGIGRYFTHTNRASISFMLGPAWQNTNYRQAEFPVSHQNLAAALLRADVQLFKFSKTNLDVTATLLPALSQPGRVRFNTETSYYVTIIGNLKWNLSFYGNWDNRPPSGFANSDYGTSSGLSWTFGLK